MKFIRKHKKAVIIICLLVLHTVISYPLNCYRISHDKSPLFLSPGSQLKDGGTRPYYGIGYEVIDWNELGGKNGYEIRTPFYDKYFEPQ